MRLLAPAGTPIDLESRKDRLSAELQATEGLIAALLFGSHGTPYQTPLSDVDIAIVYRPDLERGASRHLEATARICAAIGSDDVSVVDLRRAPVTLQHAVLSEGRPLVVADQTMYADFIEEVIDRYCDYAPVHQTLVREYDSAMVERYASR
jgi:predicted nucleotidyltransferase